VRATGFIAEGPAAAAAPPAGVGVGVGMGAASPPAAPAPLRQRSRLRRKYQWLFGLVVSAAVLVPGAVELAVELRDGRATVARAQAVVAAEVARALTAELTLVERHLASVALLPWEVPGWLGDADRRAEYQRLLRISPSVLTVAQVGADGREGLRVSRLEIDRLAPEPGAAPSPAPPPSALPAASAAVPGRTTRFVVPPATRAAGYEPEVALRIAAAEAGRGQTVVTISLRAMSQDLRGVLSAGGAEAIVVEASGAPVLHPRPELLLEQRTFAPADWSSLRAAAAARTATAITGLDGAPQVASAQLLPSLGWWVVVAEPRARLDDPLLATATRTILFWLIGLVFALWAARALAHRMAKPVIALHEGARRLASGDLSARVNVRTADELQDVAAQFNAMAAQLQAQVATLESTVAERTRALALASQHKDDFLAAMSHELRTPLNAVIGFADVLREGMAGPLSLEQAEYVGDIHASGMHLLSLINDVLDLARIEAGQLELEPQAFDVPGTLAASVRLVRQRALRHEVRVVTHIDEAVQTWVADPRRFKQMVLNLLANAVKFTPAGGEVRLCASCSAEVGLAVAVADTGVGIAAADHARVFEAFRQVGDSGAARAEGTGLGLALVQLLARQHGGFVELNSAPGEGSTFVLVLPAAAAGAA
jgi:signal transduction histidine kinase